MTEIVIRSGDAPEVEAFLAARIYEHNAAATGYYDADSFTATVTTRAGAIEAGLSGYTWGGCCYITGLWVQKASRGQGLGRDLLGSAERHARAKRCRLMLLSSHTFQAPDFYAKQGFEQIAVIDDHPVGHADVVYAKRLI